ncbi:MAG: glycosyltransferase family 2 protein [Planctomycetes bacterium]|nr:glycosyltransferase family 2 protein [Planctomycetota bacterium]
MAESSSAHSECNESHRAPLRIGVSVIVPVYNAEGTIRGVVDGAVAALVACHLDYEIILVNDGSRDASQNAITDIAGRNPRVRWIELGRNFGQHNALLCGIREARYDCTVTIDDDLQHPPSEIPKLLVPLAAGADVVYGAPVHQRHGIWRDITSVVTKWALRTAMGVSVAGDVTAFRAIRTELRNGFAEFEGPHLSLDVLLSWTTNRFVVIRVDHMERTIGESNYSVRKLMRVALNLVTGFSDLPLRMASLVGLLLSCVGFLMLAYTVVRYLIEGAVVHGFAFIACSIAMFSGAQLLALGILGEYLAQVHRRTMRMPTYVVRNSAGRDARK